MPGRSVGNVSIDSSLTGSVVCKLRYKRLGQQASSFFLKLVLLVCVWLFEDVFSTDVFVTVLKRLSVQ